MKICHILLIVTVILTPICAFADEPAEPNVGYRSWLGAGAMVINGGIAMANGYSLSNGTANRANGVFGVVLGSTTMAISAVSLAVAEDNQAQNFSLLLGAAGLASAVTGALSIKFSAPNGDPVTVTPLVNPFGSRDSAKAGIQLKIRF